MREILFRGIRIDNGEWVYGDLVHMAHNGINRIIDIGIREICSHPFEVNPETIGQFTGLLDKNGVKIFEGDIITYTDFRGNHTVKDSKHDGYIQGWKGIIEWNNRIGWYLNKDNEHNKKILNRIGGELHDRTAPYIYHNDVINKIKPEIISNIHEPCKQ